jgi:hypothetical protein
MWRREVFQTVLRWLFSLLPPRALNALIGKLDAAEKRLADPAYRPEESLAVMDLTDMRAAKTTPFDYNGGELLHRDGGYASFMVKGHGSQARWGVTFDAIRDSDPEWKDIVSSMRKSKAALMDRANGMLAARAFEQDGTILVRTLRA